MGISHMILKPHIGHNMAVITNLLNVLTLARHQCATISSRTKFRTIFRTITHYLFTNNFIKSSLVRQRAAQWKEKEALGGRLPIPVPKAKD